ncbi:hypothetical protein [Sulfurirhabdus autotrophica]|uniref:Uncharacterized protein n=1 Tax=Sulfurirhabdus autotrophica TaxID=1706046 RepID=A0A4V2W1I2_9PROT|nr:hypothetical protein [Sulfurirhabdus autotrophica]TCV84309.1 hypothetical protein EDC63_11274 [Sulfurirhabdus autotrophica]
MDITCYRDTELLRESNQIPAASYNLAKTLVARSSTGVVFLPIRSMQYLAILDATEFVFIDGERKSLIDIAWQHFSPQDRASLDDPVAYEAVYYYSHSKSLMPRLQSEFHKVLVAAASKEKAATPAKVLKFEIKR